MPCPICDQPSRARPTRIRVRGTVDKGQADRVLVTCEACAIVYARDFQLPKYEAVPVSKFNFDERGPRFDGFGYHLGLIHRHALPPGKMLDVGASAGFAVRNACSNGWDAMGVEAARELAEWGTKHLQVPIVCRLPEGSSLFDVITSSEVIEHIPQPVPWLERLFQLHAPGGLLFLTTPNADSIPAREDPGGWQPMRNRQHCVLFGMEGLKRLLTRVGWQFVEGFTACGPHDDEMLHLIARKPGQPRVRTVSPATLRALGASDPRRSVALHEYVALGTPAATTDRAATGRLDRLEARLQTLEESAGSREVEAETLILKDPHGEIRAVLGSEFDGTVQLQLFDRSGTARCRIGVDAEGAPLLALADGDGRSRLGAVLDGAGGPSLGLYDGEGNVRGVLALDTDGSPQLIGV